MLSFFTSQSEERKVCFEREKGRAERGRGSKARHNVLSRWGGWSCLGWKISVTYCPKAIGWAEGSFYNVLSRQGGWRGCTWKKISVLYCTEAIGRVEGPFDNVLSRREG